MSEQVLSYSPDPEPNVELPVEEFEEPMFLTGSQASACNCSGCGDNCVEFYGGAYLFTGVASITFGS